MASDDGRDFYEDEPRTALSGLNDGARYALAIVLNLAFLGAVIGGFAWLYMSSSRPADEAPPARVAEAAAPAQTGLAADTPVGPRSALASSAAENETDDEEVGGGGSAISFEASADDEAVETGEPAPNASAASALELPADAVEPVGVEDLPPEDLLRDERLAGLQTETAEAAPAEPAPAAPGPWAAAGELAAALQADHPCSEFVLAAAPDGGPLLRARIGAGDDREAIAARIAETLGDSAELSGGIGCTSTMSAGFVVVSDADGEMSLLSAADLTPEIRAVLPPEAACEVVGFVIDTEPRVLSAMAALEGPAAWVRTSDGAALCRPDDDGAWIASDAGGRRGAALIVGDDVIAASARRAANLGPAADLEELRSAVAPAPAEASPSEPESSSPARPLRAGPDGLVEVAPVSGPSPRLPDGVDPSPDGDVVTVSFTVDEAGAPSDLTIVSAGFSGMPVVQAALETVSASRYPPAAGGPYRARHTVRFPSASFENLLDRLSAAALEPQGRSASPIWDRQPDEEDYNRVYPERAINRGQGGEATLDCTILFDGRLECAVASESPQYLGFGDAAISLAERMRAAPRMSDGSPSADRQIDLRFNFRPVER